MKGKKMKGNFMSIKVLILLSDQCVRKVKKESKQHCATLAYVRKHALE